ncbi:hypothetical protein GOM49_01055 [Clostridium bovifaecis]|uniref:PsbP C-terminal domain-containing protein n=1 Tax=Clostridium bovifaecis TaxID=2184719 RepID=A0A6I6EJA7_9CLOT|nr:hypothetical protein GOM49_01055 [Clostridium bovifaecis]
MKIIIMNRRKLQVFLILMVLMAILFGVGEMLKGQLKSVSFMQNNIKALKTFEALDGSISYKLPSEWTTDIKSFPGNQIIYHNDFTSKDLLINGFVQVWDEQEDLKEFLDISKKVSEGQNKIKNYKITNIKVDNKEGYLVKYNMNSRDIDYTAYEYFIKYKKGFIRFSFFTKSKDFKEYMKALYDSIVKTVEVKEA